MSDDRYLWTLTDEESERRRIRQEDQDLWLERRRMRQDFEREMKEREYAHLETIERLKKETEELKLESARLQADANNLHILSLKELESRIRIAEAKHIQPVEVQKLLVEALGRYGELREKAMDEAIRNPALRDQLRSRAMGYQEMQTTTKETIDGLMSSDLPAEAKKALMAEYIKRMGQHTEDYLKKM